MSEETEPKEYYIEDDAVLSALKKAIDDIPPYHRNRLTNVRHIINAVQAFWPKLKIEAEVKSTTGKYDPDGQKKADAEGKNRIEETKKAIKAKKSIKKETEKEK